MRVAKLRTMVEKINNSTNKNEANTINSIVNPILNIYGWNVFDDNEVSMQSNNISSSGIPDIALMDNANVKNIYCFIEVKKINDINLKRHKKQGFNYCYETGVNILIITNGRRWDFYTPLISGYSEEERLFLSLDLSETDIEISNEHFNNLLNKENYKNNKIYTTIEEYFVKNPLIQGNLIIEEAIIKYISSDEFHTLIKSRVENDNNFKIDNLIIKNKIEILKSLFLENSNKKIVKKESKYSNKGKDEKGKKRDELKEKIKKYIEENFPEETIGVRDGELRIPVGSEDVGVFIRINVLHKKRMIKFQIMIKDHAEEMYQKLKLLLEDIRKETGLELRERNTNNVRTDRKNHLFDYEHDLINQQRIETINESVHKFIQVVQILRKQVIFAWEI